MTCQAMNFRSIQSSKVQLMLGIYAWATGTSKQTVEVLGASGLSVSHPTIMKTVDTVAEQSIADARSLSFEPHVATYDNIDISGSEHVEQRRSSSLLSSSSSSSSSLALSELLSAVFRLSRSMKMGPGRWS